MAHYLVTGGAGFIGSHIVARLRAEGHRVRVLDNFSTGRRENLAGLENGLEIVRGDICDAALCLQCCRGVDYLIHEAALRSVPGSLEKPLAYNRVNIDGTLNVLTAARESGVKQVAFASSSSIYGEAVRFPQKETDLPALVSPYALSKLAGEYYARIFTLHFGLPVASLRYFNVFGERQSLEDEYAVVIPKFINCLLNGQPPPIYGDGRQSRDFTHVANVVNATLAAARTAAAGGQVFNVGCGHDYSILELVEQLARIIGTPVKPEFRPVRKGDVLRTRADITQAARVLGYKPEVDFAAGLERAVAWFRRAWGKTGDRDAGRA